MARPEIEDPPPVHPALRWLVVWAVLTMVYAAAGLIHRASSRDQGAGGSWAAVEREDLVHLGLVPLAETAALALVARLRRRP